MSTNSGSAWTDRYCLAQVQYRTDANLAARQSIYAYQRPRIDLPAATLGLAHLDGMETVVDIGCGNGAYLATLAERGHSGPVFGVDLSPGMLDAARRKAQAATLIAGDAAALPLADNIADLSLAMHMLYHVPDPQAATSELRRITRDGGQVLVVLNGEDHLRELLDAVAAALPGALARGTMAGAEPLRLGRGAELLGTRFESVTRYDFRSELLIPDPGPVEDYVRSMMITHNLSDPEDLVATMRDRISWGDKPFRVQTHCGCLVCR